MVKGRLSRWACPNQASSLKAEFSPDCKNLRKKSERCTPVGLKGALTRLWTAVTWQGAADRLQELRMGLPYSQQENRNLGLQQQGNASCQQHTSLEEGTLSLRWDGSPSQRLDFSLERPWAENSPKRDLQTCEIINFSCFMALSLWSFVMQL